MDARRPFAPTSLPRFAGGQEARGSRSRASKIIKVRAHRAALRSAEHQLGPLTTCRAGARRSCPGPLSPCHPRRPRLTFPRMAFKDFPEQAQGISLLQRSLERGRLAHAYLFTGHELAELEAIAQTLAKVLNCQQPVRGKGGVAIDCCDQCANCRKIANGNHADVHWIRPESKSRTVSVAQMRDLMQEINLKPTEAEYKVADIVAAD